MRTALTVGINKYAELPDSTLAGCVADSESWGLKLQSKKFDVSTLTDGFATRAVILNALKEYVRELTSGDTFIFTNSSHGTWVVDEDGDESDRRDEAICPYDVAESGPITDDELYEIFSSKAAGSKVIFISDSCHSGTLARFAPALALHGARGPWSRSIRFMPPSVWQREVPALKVMARSINAPTKSKSRMGALVLAGCKDDEYSYDTWIDGKPCGAFTYSALKALDELTARSNSSSSSSSSARTPNYLDWQAAIRQRLPSVEYPQTPQLTGTSTQKRWAIFA